MAAGPWAPIWPALSERFTVIAPDMIGMAFSAKPAAYEYSVADHADMREAQLAHLKPVGACHAPDHASGRISSPTSAESPG